MNILHIVEYWYTCYRGLIPAMARISPYLVLLITTLLVSYTLLDIYLRDTAAIVR